jgi:hypothetical protein
LPAIEPRPICVAMVAWLPLIVALVGLLVYALSTNGKVSAVGLALFTAGMTGICVAFAGRLVRLL